VQQINWEKLAFLFPSAEIGKLEMLACRGGLIEKIRYFF
jgi:hypothetical protein